MRSWLILIIKSNLLTIWFWKFRWSNIWRILLASCIRWFVILFACIFVFIFIRFNFDISIILHFFFFFYHFNCFIYVKSKMLLDILLSREFLFISNLLFIRLCSCLRTGIVTFRLGLWNCIDPNRYNTDLTLTRFKLILCLYHVHISYATLFIIIAIFSIIKLTNPVSIRIVIFSLKIIHWWFFHFFIVRQFSLRIWVILFLTIWMKVVIYWIIVPDSSLISMILFQLGLKLLVLRIERTWITDSLSTLFVICNCQDLRVFVFKLLLIDVMVGHRVNNSFGIETSNWFWNPYYF